MDSPVTRMNLSFCSQATFDKMNSAQVRPSWQGGFEKCLQLYKLRWVTYLRIDPQNEIWLVSWLSRLLPGHRPAAFECQTAQHACFAAASGAGAESLLALSLATFWGMPQPSQHLGTSAPASHA